LTSNASGVDGALAIDAGTTGLALAQLVEARDAAVVLGPTEADAPLVLNSSGNTLSEALPNVRLDLVGVSNSPVTVTITRDSDAIVRNLNLFVSAFNTAMDTIEALTRFDSETSERSPLTGDPTARDIRRRLVDLATRVVPGVAAPFDRLSAIGVDLVNGNSLQLNENKLRQALADHPSEVVALFAAKDRGLGFAIESEMKRLTDTGTGVISVQDESIKGSQDLLGRRIEQLNTLLESRRQRLLVQFQATESALARLRSQQSTLSSLGPILLGFGG
jgi:flagellar hook-associated protein 2